MAEWSRRNLGGLPIHQAEAFLTLPGIVQGFTTRHGGVSTGSYQSLNFGAHVSDDAAAVESNRQRLWSALGFSPAQVTLAEQVHGNQVAIVERGGEVAVGADALVTDCTELLLMLFFADCVPIFVVDPVKRCVALIHSGWRGTVSDIVTETISTLQLIFGSRPETCLAAIGPCISGESYEVGSEVAEQFQRPYSAASMADHCRAGKTDGKFLLDLRGVLRSQLINVGFRSDKVYVSDEDTYCKSQDFFSFRRDGKASGRMAGFLALRTP